MPPEPVDLSTRAFLSEWMDEPCTYTVFRGCLLDLEKLNRLVLAYRPIERWLRHFATPAARRLQSRPLHIVDIGSGGGDMLRRIEAWARSIDLHVQLTGIDLNPFAARAAREFAAPGSRIAWITGDAFSFEPAAPIDLVISSLFTHHLTDPDIVHFLDWMERVATRGWFINDLHRRPVPFYGYKLLAWTMQWHSFLQHDGPISFRRSFRTADWQHYARAANLDPATLDIHTAHPGRLCVERIK